MTDATSLIAQNLKLLRQQKGWSLSVCAEKTRVSKAMLGQIERGESSPTVATLWKIATGMEVSLSGLITEAVRPTALSTGLSHRTLDQGGIQVTPLLPYHAESRQEVYQLVIQPGAESFSDPHRSGTLETIMVISGTLDLWAEGRWQPVKEGSACCFHADQKHGYRNSGDCEMVFHDVVRYR